MNHQSESDQISVFLSCLDSFYEKNLVTLNYYLMGVRSGVFKRQEQSWTGDKNVSEVRMKHRRQRIIVAATTESCKPHEAVETKSHVGQRAAICTDEKP